MEIKTATATMATGYDGKNTKLITGEVEFTYQSATSIDDAFEYCGGNEGRLLDIINAQLKKLANDARKAMLIKEHSPREEGADARDIIRLEQNLMACGMEPSEIAKILNKKRAMDAAAAAARELANEGIDKTLSKKKVETKGGKTSG